MSDSNNSDRLSDLAERDKCLAISSVLPTVRTLHDSQWNKFVAFCLENNFLGSAAKPLSFGRGLPYI